MPVLYTPHFVQFFDDNGDPLSGGKLYTYAAGTTTLKATYTTAAGTIENANPIVLDSAGRAALFISGSYKFTLTDSSDVLIRTTDNVTAFTATGEASSAYFEAFSGDGSTTVFTTSQDLGTDEKLIMVYVDNGLQEHVTNGTFATDTGWTKGAGWTIGSGVATAAGAISTAISQNAGVTINAGQPYVVTMTITRDAGSLTPSLGGTAGTARSSAGTYSEIIIAGASQTIAFTGSGFTGTLDTVTIKPAASAGFNLLPTSGYTISGTTLTIALAPATGTNNIQVWAPALLSASAAASAAAASASADSAAASASLAASSSSGATGVSTTSVEIGTGSKTLTVSSGKLFSSGMYVTATDQADSANYMQGFVTSYSGTTLIITVQSVGGSGTISAWNIYPSATYLSFIASQAEAEAGTSSTKLMSPQRTAQAIASLASAKPPTKTYLTSGTGASFSTPSGATKLFIEMIGGGGGGGGSGAGATNGGTGGTTSFNSITVIGGTGGGKGTTTVSDFAGGAGGTGGTGTAALRIDGVSGGSGNNTNHVNGGSGGSTRYGGGGQSNYEASGNSASANTGAGGGGAGVSASTYYGTGGGGGGEFAEFSISTPTTTYTYTVGASGAAGTGGSLNGGAGGSGLIIVTTYF